MVFEGIMVADDSLSGDLEESILNIWRVSLRIIGHRGG